MKNIQKPITLKERAIQAIVNYIQSENHQWNSGLSEGLICALGGYKQCVDVGLDYRDACREMLNLLQSPESKLDLFHEHAAIEFLTRMCEFLNELYYNDDMKADLEKECILVYDSDDEYHLANVIKRYELKKQLDDLEAERHPKDKKLPIPKEVA